MLGRVDFKRNLDLIGGLIDFLLLKISINKKLSLLNENYNHFPKGLVKGKGQNRVINGC